MFYDQETFLRRNDVDGRILYLSEQVQADEYVPGKSSGQESGSGHLNEYSVGAKMDHTSSVFAASYYAAIRRSL